MTNRFIAVLATIFAVTACQDPGPPIDGRHDAADGTASVQDVAPRGPSEDADKRPVRSSLERALPGGLQNPTFAYHVSVDRDTGATRNGHGVREIALELLGATPQEAEVEFSALVVSGSGAVLSRQERGGSIRAVYGLPDGTSMLAWFRPGAPGGERYALQQVNATGTIYVAWPFVEKGTQ